MTTRWQHDGLHTGTRADPILKHRHGVPWYAAPLPWVLHRRCTPQTLELWWNSHEDDEFARELRFPDGGRQFCGCGATLDLEVDQRWRGRNSRRARRSTPTATYNLPLMPQRGIDLPVIGAMIGNRMMVGR